MTKLDYFDTLYHDNADPWHYQTRWYEQRKRAISLAVLPHAHYATAIELGCSNGVFSEQLAKRCDTLLCLDGNAQAVALAKHRLAKSPHVSVTQAIIPQALPVQQFDLIVIGEILYYLTLPQINAVIDWVKNALTPNGTLLCCHWRYPIDGFEMTGESVHQVLGQAFNANNGFFEQVALHDSDFLLHVWQKNPKSVAQQEGLI